VLNAAPSVSTPVCQDKNTHHIGESQSQRPPTMWKRPLTALDRRARAGVVVHPAAPAPTPAPQYLLRAISMVIDTTKRR
jgi:hypothetical protein